MFQQLLANKHHRLCDSKFGQEELWVWSPTKLKKILKNNNQPRAEHEPHSPHGCASMKDNFRKLSK